MALAKLLGMYAGRCHCGAVRWTYRGEPSHLTACTCSLCARLGALWAYGSEASIAVEGRTEGYEQGDRSLSVRRCAHCGCATHWEGLAGEAPRRWAVNMRMAEPATWAHLRIRRFDGAQSWAYLD